MNRTTTSRLIAVTLFLGLLAGCDAVGPDAGASEGSNAVTASTGTPSDELQARLRGPIKEIGKDRLTVNGLVFVVDDRTILLNQRNRPVPFSAFTAGMFVEAEGRVSADGTVRARKVKMEDADEGTSVDVRGRIEAITQTSVSVAGRTFRTNGSTRYFNERNRPIARSAFAVGTFVEAEGTQYADGSLVADKLKMDTN
jgi:hypothetical protein